MNCPNCGTDVAPNTPACPQCQQALTTTQAPAKIENYLIWSILATVLCCLPTGIYAIIKAASVDGLVARGDIAGAQEASALAKKWTIISVVVGLIFGVISIIFNVGIAAAAASQNV